MTLSFIRKDLNLLEPNGFWNILETFWDRLEPLNPIAQNCSNSSLFHQPYNMVPIHGQEMDEILIAFRKLSSTPSNNPVFVSVTLPFRGSKTLFAQNNQSCDFELCTKSNTMCIISTSRSSTPFGISVHDRAFSLKLEGLCSQPSVFVYVRVFSCAIDRFRALSSVFEPNLKLWPR